MEKIEIREIVTINGISEEIISTNIDLLEIPIEEQNPDYTDTHRMQPAVIQRCIYCGSTEEPLSKEHIIPASLGGAWTLQRSSCKDCAIITSAFEKEVARGPLWPARIYLNIRSRRKHKKAPSYFSIEVEGIDGEHKKIKVPADQFPIIVPFPIFPLPAYINPDDYSSGVSVVTHYHYSLGRDIGEITRDLGVKQVIVNSSYSPHAFALMIGKIALSSVYGTGEIDLVQDPSGLANAIIGKTNDIGRWVGTSNGTLINCPNLFHLTATQKHQKTGLLIVYVKLFAHWPLPVYCVVIGKLK